MNLKMEILKKVVHGLSIVCYVFIIVYALICAPYIFGYKPLVVLTGSMEPTFKTGSIIYYKHASREQIKEGDIITFKFGDSVVSHRVHKIEGNLYETKGDANNTVDAQKTEYNNILGKDLQMCIPYLGFYVKYINDNIYLLIIVVVILILDFILSNLKTKEKEQNEFNNKKNEDNNND